MNFYFRGSDEECWVKDIESDVVDDDRDHWIMFLKSGGRSPPIRRYMVKNEESDDENHYYGGGGGGGSPPIRRDKDSSEILVMACPDSDFSSDYLEVLKFKMLIFFLANNK